MWFRKVGTIKPVVGEGGVLVFLPTKNLRETVEESKRVNLRIE